jgi:hypothetical protein
MEFTGIIQNVAYDTVTLSHTCLTADLYKLKNTKLRIQIDKYREKRSLDANAYAWQLMTKIASVLRTSKEEIYEVMLREYGSDFTDEDGNIVFINNAHGKKLHLPGLHFAFVESYFDNGEEKDKYRLIKGSSQYDTKEMSVLIDGVVSECKDLGIETLPPDQLRVMKERWGV